MFASVLTLYVLTATPAVDAPQIPAAIKAAAATPAPGTAVYLGEHKLNSVGGTFDLRGFMTKSLFAVFPDPASGVKTAGPKPCIWILSLNSPKGRLYLARTESKSGHRETQMGEIGVFGFKGLGAPNPKWEVPYSAEEVQPGLWVIQPSQELGPGEYLLMAPVAPTGLGASPAGEAWGFNIDRS